MGQDVLATGAFCCSGMAAAVTASQSPNWGKAWTASANALGTGAKVVGGGFAAIGGGVMYVARCSVNLCSMVANLAQGNAPAVRSIDAPPAFKNENLIARYAQPELEFKEDTVLLSRYTDEPESDEDVFGIN